MHPLESLIRNVPDFPKAGIMFKDITPLMTDHFPDLIQSMGEKIPWHEIDAVVGVEARGFILGSAMALHYGKGFIPVRKKGKLPPPTIAQSYELEYGVDTIEMSAVLKPARVVIVDDVLATGGTMRAVMSLCEKNKMDIKALSVFINLTFLNTFQNEKVPLFSPINY